MSFFNVMLWTFTIIIGAPLLFTALALRLNAANNRELDALDSVDFRKLQYEKLPWFVRRLIGKYRREALDSGFQEIACFTRANFGAPNFCCALVSPDKRCVQIVEYVRVSPLVMLFMLFLKPRDFMRFLLGAYGATITTSFNGGRRFITTRHAYLAADNVPGEKEFNVMPGQSTFAAILAEHCDKVATLVSRENLAVTEFHTEKDYLDFERAMLAKLATRCRQESEAGCVGGGE